MKQQLDMTLIESSAGRFLGDLVRKGKQLRNIRIDDPHHGGAVFSERTIINETGISKELLKGPNFRKNP